MTRVTDICRRLLPCHLLAIPLKRQFPRENNDTSYEIHYLMWCVIVADITIVKHSLPYIKTTTLAWREKLSKPIIIIREPYTVCHFYHIYSPSTSLWNDQLNDLFFRFHGIQYPVLVKDVILFFFLFVYRKKKRILKICH